METDPIDETLGKQLENTEAQIQELKRREENALRIATESSHVNVQSLDIVLEEIRTSLNSLIVFRDQLRGRLEKGEVLEVELFRVVQRLNKLEARIDKSTYEEKRRAVEELVKGIEVVPEVVNGKKIAIVTITYRFNSPDSPPSLPPDLISGVESHTSGRAGIMESLVQTQNKQDALILSRHAVTLQFL